MSRVGVLDAAEGLVGEHHPEAERVVGRIPLPDPDLGVRTQLLGERGEIQPARPAAHHRDPHVAAMTRPDRPVCTRLTGLACC